MIAWQQEPGSRRAGRDPPALRPDGSDLDPEQVISSADAGAHQRRPRPGRGRGPGRRRRRRLGSGHRQRHADRRRPALPGARAASCPCPLVHATRPTPSRCWPGRRPRSCGAPPTTSSPSTASQIADTTATAIRTFRTPLRQRPPHLAGHRRQPGRADARAAPGRDGVRRHARPAGVVHDHRPAPRRRHRCTSPSTPPMRRRRCPAPTARASRRSRSSGATAPSPSSRDTGKSTSTSAARTLHGDGDRQGPRRQPDRRHPRIRITPAKPKPKRKSRRHRRRRAASPPSRSAGRPMTSPRDPATGAAGRSATDAGRLRQTRVGQPHHPPDADPRQRLRTGQPRIDRGPERRRWRCGDR